MKNLSKKKINSLMDKHGLDRATFNEPLEKHTYFKIGGLADLFFIAKTSDDLLKAKKFCLEAGVGLTILGAGSNVLIKDGGIEGLVVKNRADKISVAGFRGRVLDKKLGVNSVLVKAESGVVVNRLVRFCIDESLKGLEVFLGIPGTVGGAIFNNSHYREIFIGDFVQDVEVIDVDGKVKKYSNYEMNFAYDYSILQKTKEIVISATFLLNVGNKKILWEKAEKVLMVRRDSQPLGFPSSGCIFKNITKAESIRFAIPNQSTSAGFLIDKAGLKGSRVGGAKVSEKHANFIVNTGGATARDVIELADKIENKVKEKYGVKLKKEVFILGRD